jgi:hypothetical protein
VEEMLVRIKEKLVDISHNMALLMPSLANKFRTFWEVGGSNLVLESHEKIGDSKYIGNK